MYLIDINVSAEIDEHPSLRFQDIRKKNKVSRTDTRTDGRTDNVKTVYPTTNKVCGRYNNLDIPLDRQLKLFHNTVVHILTYGSALWGYENLDMIQKVHNDFFAKSYSV